MSTNGKLHRFAWLHSRNEESQSRRNRRKKPEFTRERDSGAFIEIQPRLLQEFDWGGSIYNHPHPDAHRYVEREPPLIEVDTSNLGRGDLLVSTTRSPLGELFHGVRGPVLRSYTTLERDYLNAFLPYVRLCTRAEVAMSAAMAALLTPPFENRAHVCLRSYGNGAEYLWFDRDGRREFPDAEELKRTAAFALRIEEIWPGGPGLLALWAMTEPLTLGWAHRVACDYPHLLHTPGFAMAEIEAGPLPDRPDSPEFAREWKIDWVLDHRSP